MSDYNIQMHSYNGSDYDNLSSDFILKFLNSIINIIYILNMNKYSYKGCFHDYHEGENMVMYHKNVHFCETFPVINCYEIIFIISFK